MLCSNVTLVLVSKVETGVVDPGLVVARTHRWQSFGHCSATIFPNTAVSQSLPAKNCSHALGSGGPLQGLNGLLADAACEVDVDFAGGAVAFVFVVDSTCVVVVVVVVGTQASHMFGHASSINMPNTVSPQSVTVKNWRQLLGSLIPLHSVVVVVTVVDVNEGFCRNVPNTENCIPSHVKVPPVSRIHLLINAISSGNVLSVTSSSNSTPSPTDPERRRPPPQEVCKDDVIGRSKSTRWAGNCIHDDEPFQRRNLLFCQARQIEIPKLEEKFCWVCGG